MPDDRYIIIPDVQVLAVKETSILIQHPIEDREVWIGRSTIAFLTDDRLDEYNRKRIPFPVTMPMFRVFAWLAKKERLIESDE